MVLARSSMGFLHMLYSVSIKAHLEVDL